jgi:hypothetical protein
MHRDFISTPAMAADADQLEASRLAALDHFDVLDTPREESFDRITRLIKNIFGLPIAIVSMFDGHRQWYKAYEGLDSREAAKGETFCRYTVKGLLPVVVSERAGGFTVR